MKKKKEEKEEEREEEKVETINLFHRGYIYNTQILALALRSFFFSFQFRLRFNSVFIKLFVRSVLAYLPHHHRHFHFSFSNIWMRQDRFIEHC